MNANRKTKTKPAAVRPADLVSAFGTALHDAGYIGATPAPVNPAAPTTPENKTRIGDMFASMQATMQNLHARWQDEHEHEKISDYAAAIKLPAGFNLIRMTARPFGFEFDIGTGARYFVSITRTSYRWGRK